MAEPVEAIDETVHALWAEMLAAMYAMPGIGLAAPQLGVRRRVIVVDASDARNAPVRMVNPVITARGDGSRTGPEGSPNLPGLWAEVSRPDPVTVAWTDAEGAQQREFSGLWATSVQHQIDHLEGRIFLDRLGPVRRRMLLARHEKLNRRRREVPA